MTTFDPLKYPALAEIAQCVLKAPFDLLRMPMFVVPRDLFQRGYNEAFQWAEEVGRASLTNSDLDRPNFMWRGCWIVAADDAEQAA